MTRALVLVDLQNDFLAAPGLEPAAGELIRRAAALLAGWRAAGRPVFHVLTGVRPDGAGAMPHWRAAGRLRCVLGTPGAEPPALLAPRDAEMTSWKTSYGGFEGTSLEAMLRDAGITGVVLAGLHLHACVRETALGALARGLDVTIAEDAVGSDDPLHAAAARRWLAARGVAFAPVSALLMGEAPPWAPEDTGGVRALCAAAHAAAAPWAARPQAERAACLSRAAGLLRERAPGLARGMAVEVGKPIRDAAAEVERTAALLDAAARAPEPPVLAHGPGASSRRVPHGVVALVTPWNNPVAIPAGKIGPALVYGNAVVWKPSPAAPESARFLHDIFLAAGIPPGVLGLLPGGDREARALCADPEIDAVSLSGSSAAGWSAQEVCGRRRIPLQAELGGNNGAIVWGDANLAAAARLIAGGAFSFAGQRCTANRRAIVDRAVLDAFLAELATATGRLRLGDPLDPATDLGPLVSAAAARRVEELVARAVSQGEGCRLAAAPLGPPVAAGAFLPPAILIAEDPGCEVVQEESFGPVLVIQPADDFEHALELLNGVPQGLIAALFSPHPERRARFLAEARAGILKLDRSTVDASAEAPFGGFKASGIGPPEHGPGNLEFYRRVQTIYGPA
jgi:acyl-CoA reductase-like NAD-dependent aldehyde dehydrogenase/nicotinamidase-related amidase